MPRWVPALVLLLLPVAARPAPADVLVPKSGKAVPGVLVADAGGEVVFNPYWSRNPGMTYGLIRKPAGAVKKVEIAPRPEPGFWRQMKDRKAGDVAALCALGRWAAEQKLKSHAEMAWALAVAEDAACAEALQALGGKARFEALKRGNPDLDPAVRGALKRYAGEADPKARAAIGAELAALGVEAKPYELERLRRSACQPTGYEPERPIRLRSDVHVGATYALLVPEGYDPSVPWPLILGLHGGGPDGKARDEVVGSGPSAMNFYRDLANQRGFLVACPTALVANWGHPRNEALVRDVIAEVKTLYNVDVDRVYMTGHSMGGYGTWELGPRMAPDLAAVSPMAGAGGGGLQALVENRTAIFIYHSDNDFIDVSPDRAAAKRLSETDHDFVYTELPGQGHGFPESIRTELFDFLEVRRRQDKSYREAWPRSSLLGKVTKEEETYFDDPEAELRGKGRDLTGLVAWLRLGGGCAAAALARITETKPEGAADEVSRVFKDPKASPDARAWAARTLALLGDPREAPSLRKAVAAPATRDGSRMTIEAANALVLLKDATAESSLEKSIEGWTKYYEEKVTGSQIRISDFERALRTLAAVVDAWGVLAEKGDASFLKKTVIARVLAPQHEVQISDRVPQDPSEARTALAKSIAGALAKRGGSAADWDALLASLTNDEKARTQAAGLRP